MQQLQHHVDLTQYNTFGFAAVAEQYVRITDVTEVPQVCDYCEREKLPLLILGGGSNIVLGYRIPGVVAHMELTGFSVEERDNGQVAVTVGAGESWHDTVVRTLEHGFYGLENLALIPGSVGASPVQNIGAYGVEVKDYLEYVDVYDNIGRVFTRLSKAECDFSYRDSIFKSKHPGRYIITAVQFVLNREPKLNLGYASLLKACQEIAGDAAISPQHVFEAVCRLRENKLPDPAQIGSAGSFFKNPVVSADHYRSLQSRYPNIVAYPDGQGYKLAAGWLIDQCGWRGKSMQQVGVYEKQALVLVNRGGGNREQLEQLAKAIQASVQERFGVVLEPEPRFYP